MRNLKKVLALVLALAMALSVMASAFTAPEYTEEAQAEYDAMTAAQQNAFYVVSALGIVEGFSDGSFRPEENLTRAQFAAMVYRAKTGDVAKENTLFSSASVAMFSDAIDTWAIPYVAYAYSAGIVAGYPDGTFKATKAVTGLEAAKMLLTALGYDAEIEGLVGPTFYANTIKLGTAVGLFNGVKGDIYAPATRADAFVMFANALKANTVSYVGGVATPKTETLNSEDIITLGEEGFDLLDVEAILVATEDAALGAYWRNVITAGNAYGIEYENYQAAPAGYARFVYRDYVATNAANKGANYYDRVITVKLPVDAEGNVNKAMFAELGEKYRLLVTDMSPVYNENEFRAIYGVPAATTDVLYYEVKTGEVNALGAGVIDAMAQRYVDCYNDNNGTAADIEYKKLADSLKEKDPVWDVTDNTIFVNGSAVSFRAARAYAGKLSTAPYKSVDNDKDGVVDHLFIYDYTIGTVKAIADETITLVGTGLGTIKKADFIVLPELAVGDYVAVWKDGDGKYAKKLDVKEANVTGYNANGYTIDGSKYVVGAYINSGAESLLGNAASAITETVYKYVFDGKYIVNVELTENTRFAKYALVDFVNNGMNDSYLGYPHIRLYTEDNEFVNAYVKTVNGIQVYPYQNFESLFYNIEEATLVSYTLDGDFAYIDVIEDPTVGELSDTFDGNYISEEYDFYYNRATGTWEGVAEWSNVLEPDNWDDFNFTGAINSTISMKDTHGVVFVTYEGKDADVADNDYRAYYNGEFQPSYYNEYEAKLRDGSDDLVVYATQNGMNYIKAAKITFDHRALGYKLPGLPTTRANDNFAIIKSVSVEKTADGFVYTYTTFAPGGGTETYTSVPFAYQQGQPAPYTVWNLTTNADGKVTAHTMIDALVDGLGEDSQYILGTNGMEMYGYFVTSFNMDVYGNITMQVADMRANWNDGKIVRNDMNYIGADIMTYTINLSADADVWFFEAAAYEAGKITALTEKNADSYIGYDYNNAPSDKKFVAFVDMNPTTQTANRVIIVSGDYANKTIAPNEVVVSTLALYDADTKKVTYVLLPNVVDDLADLYGDVVAEEIEYAIGVYEVDNVLPIDSEFPAGNLVEFTFSYNDIDREWEIVDVKGNAGTEKVTAKTVAYDTTDGLVWTYEAWHLTLEDNIEEDLIKAVYGVSSDKADDHDTAKVKILYNENGSKPGTVQAAIDAGVAATKTFYIVENIYDDEVVIVFVGDLAKMTGTDVDGSPVTGNDTLDTNETVNWGNIF